MPGNLCLLFFSPNKVYLSFQVRWCLLALEELLRSWPFLINLFFISHSFAKLYLSKAGRKKTNPNNSFSLQSLCLPLRLLSIRQTICPPEVSVLLSTKTIKMFRKSTVTRQSNQALALQVWRLMSLT